MIEYERAMGGLAAYRNGKLIGWILRTIPGWTYQTVGGGRSASDYSTVEIAMEEFEKNAS